jgi:hypothetical protein
VIQFRYRIAPGRLPTFLPISRTRFTVFQPSSAPWHVSTSTP